MSTGMVGYELTSLPLRPTMLKPSSSSYQTVSLSMCQANQPCFSSQPAHRPYTQQTRTDIGERFPASATLILKRQVKRPALTQRDRVLFVRLASKLHSWKSALVQGARMAPCDPIHCCAGIAISLAGCRKSLGQRSSAADHGYPRKP